MKKLITYITSSLHGKEFTSDLSNAMYENGADIVEIGIVFSDPSADGKIIEKANLISLQNGFEISDILYILEQTPNVPTYLMGYFNSFYKQGFEYFFDNGFDNLKGAIIPDLPYEESLIYQNVFDKFNKNLTSFISPLSSTSRIKEITKISKGFIYLIAYVGITGGGKETNLDNIISDIRVSSDTPIYLGFGVNESNAKEKCKNVDGIIVATHLMKILIDDNVSLNDKIKKISNICNKIKNEINS